MKNNEVKLALVTGASRGIGRAIAQRLSEDGYCVAGTATAATGAERITDWMAESGFSGRGFVLDVSVPEQVSRCLSEIHDVLGMAPSILVNNAGITRDDLFMRMKPADWNAVIETNLTSVYTLTQSCIRAMMKARWGRVINVSSVVASSGNPGQTNYAAAKAGMIGLSKSLAIEVASRGVTVNVISPGFIVTDMTGSLTAEQQQAICDRIPMQRMGRPEDVAAAASFLASDDSAYVTGATMHVNGGMYLS